MSEGPCTAKLLCHTGRSGLGRHAQPGGLWGASTPAVATSIRTYTLPHWPSQVPQTPHLSYFTGPYYKFISEPVNNPKPRRPYIYVYPPVSKDYITLKEWVRLAIAHGVQPCVAHSTSGKPASPCVCLSSVQHLRGCIKPWSLPKTNFSVNSGCVSGSTTCSHTCLRRDWVRHQFFFYSLDFLFPELLHK